jgi:hypothetical protein
MNTSKLLITQEALEYCESYYEQYDNHNTFRIAEKGNTQSEQEYTELMEEGKGNAEDFIPIPKFLTGGREYYFGFNFYHSV